MSKPKIQGEGSVRRVMIGTAGHIDHGKSSLVRALTGIDPDHLKEEKERGLTIDLGRATFKLPHGVQVGVIDVPGHERFIKNMVAGATSVDLVLLVVAADDGVMPQTREHMEILSFLGVKRYLVALTKIDSVDPEMLSLAREDLEEFLSTSGLKGVPILPVSSITGEGVEELGQELIRLVEEVPPRPLSGLFRLPVQRVFRKEGFGTVLGGVPVAGQAKKGETLQVLPAGIKGRLRGIQTYGRSTDVASAGHSCALNLPDVQPHLVSRGAYVVKPGMFHLGRQVFLHLRTLPEAKSCKSGAMVRLHVGTAEMIGHLYLPRGKAISPGASSMARLRLEEPTVLVPGDRYILRLQAPPRTLGGGLLVLPDPNKHPLKGEWLRALEAMHHFLIQGDGSGFLEEVIKAAKLHPRERADLACLAGRPLEETQSMIDHLVDQGRLVVAGRGVLHLQAIERICRSVLKDLERRADQDPLSPEVSKPELTSSLGLSPQVMEAVLKELGNRKAVESLSGGKVRLAGRGQELTGSQLAQAETLLALLAEAGHQPLTEEEVLARTGLDPSFFSSLVTHLQNRGRIVRVAGIFLYDGRSFQEARNHLILNCKANGPLDLPQFRDSLATTRKFVIPLLEHFDGIGLTARRGSNRMLRDESAGAEGNP